MIKFIHTGDVHLGLQFNNVSFSKDKAIERRRELWATFQRITRYSSINQFDFLFIAGDLFESDYFTIGDINRVRDIFAEAIGVNILISAGNHDNLGTKSLYHRVEWSENVTIFSNNGIESKYFEKVNTMIYGYSWDRLELKENVLFKNPPLIDRSINNILLIHGDINTESNYLPLALQELNSLEMDYIGLGHIHKPNIFSNKIAYCGSPEPLDFGEIGQRGVIEGSIENGVTNIHFLPFSKRCFYEIDLELNENLGYLEITNKIKDIDIGNKDNDFYRVKLKGYVQKDIDLSLLYADVEHLFYHLELFDKTTLDYDLDVLEKFNSGNIIGKFIKTMKEMDLEDMVTRDALYLGLEALLKDRY